MPTRQEVRDTITLNHNAYHDKWNSIETPSERFAGTQDLRDIRDNYIESLDPGLRQAFSDAKEFMKNEHAYVYWNSGWSNCTDYDNILGLYHGVSKWDHINGDGFDMNEEFTAANISPRQILLDGFRFDLTRCVMSKQLVASILHILMVMNRRSLLSLMMLLHAMRI